MNKKIFLLGALTLCVTTASIAMQKHKDTGTSEHWLSSELTIWEQQLTSKDPAIREAANEQFKRDFEAMLQESKWNEPWDKNDDEEWLYEDKERENLREKMVTQWPSKLTHSPDKRQIVHDIKPHKIQDTNYDYEPYDDSDDDD